MKQTALKYFGEMDLSLLALVLFLFAFSFMIYRVYFYEKAETIDALSRIPFERGEGGDVQ